jgi:hypothetical protein
MRKRNALTVGQLIEYLSKYPKEAKVYAAPSLVNLDEPPETQEFIDHEVRTKVVSMEGPDPDLCNLKTILKAGVTVGYVKE